MNARLRRWVEQSIIIKLAGPLAEARLGEDPGKVQAGAGMVKLAKPLRTKDGVEVTHHTASGSDYGLLNDLLWKVTRGDDEMASAWNSLLRVRAERLVDSHWDIIIHLAQALDERKTLDREAVGLVIEEYRRNPGLGFGK